MANIFVTDLSQKFHWQKLWAASFVFVSVNITGPVLWQNFAVSLTQLSSSAINHLKTHNLNLAQIKRPLKLLPSFQLSFFFEFFLIHVVKSLQQTTFKFPPFFSKSVSKLPIFPKISTKHFKFAQVKIFSFKENIHPPQAKWYSWNTSIKMSIKIKIKCYHSTDLDSWNPQVVARAGWLLHVDIFKNTLANFTSYI